MKKSEGVEAVVVWTAVRRNASQAGFLVEVLMILYAEQFQNELVVCFVKLEMIEQKTSNSWHSGNELTQDDVAECDAQRNR